MANTPEGTPYVESSDLVANYPAASLALANRVDLVGVLPFANAAARTTAIPSPTDGQYTYLQDTNSTQFWNGAAWVEPFNTGAWVSWSPSYSGITVGNGTVEAKYFKIGRTVVARWTLTFGSTTTIGSNPLITLPVNAAVSTLQSLGTSFYQDTGTSVQFGPGVLFAVNALILKVHLVTGTYLDDAAVNATAPFTWTTGDIAGFQITYEGDS